MSRYRKTKSSPRVVICYGKKGRKCRVRYPSRMGGYITHTFCSIESAKKYLKDDVSPQQARKAKITKI